MGNKRSRRRTNKRRKTNLYRRGGASGSSVEDRLAAIESRMDELEATILVATGKVTGYTAAGSKKNRDI